MVSALLLWTAGSAAAGFRVRDAHARPVDNVYLLDASIDYEFSDASLEALRSGVPLTVTLDMEVVRKRAYLWDEQIASLQARHQLHIHALSGQYVLKNLSSGAIRTFSTLQEAQAALGTIRGFPLLDGQLVDNDGEYELRLRARLDIEALPTPLRPLAYLSSLWRLASEWSEWPIPH